ncbi:MAG: hypothetical protein Q4B54_12780 [Coriobacteriales bacterium]|nr:hypothetical protein [Coriobacteriales bacterium]
MAQETNKSKKKNVRAAERAVDRAFSTGKADRAAITRRAQLDAAEAVAMAGIAMESDEAADEAEKIALIANSMGNREKSKAARDQARQAHAQAKADHRAATKSAKQAYDAIKFSDPTKLGFMRFVQITYLLNIITMLAVLILTSRDTVVYNSVNILDWILVALETVAFYFFIHRFKLARPLCIGIGVLGIVGAFLPVLTQGQHLSFSTFLGAGFHLAIVLYFIFSSRVKAVLVNDFSTERGLDDEEDEFVIDRRSWPFYRNLIIYFVIFSVLGHWMEAGMCQFIRLGWVAGDYDPNNTMLWRDWLYPYPMEGAAVVLIALFLYPFFIWLKKKFTNRIIPYVLSFISNALLCTLIEFIGGLMFNANLQNWNYSNLPFNFMGQVCLQNTLAFGVAASIISWFVYPALERAIARVRPATMNIVCVVVAIAGGILFSLYAISPPDGIDLGQQAQQTAEQQAEAERKTIGYDIVLINSGVDNIEKIVQEYKPLTDEQRNGFTERLNKIRQDTSELETYVNSTI